MTDYDSRVQKEPTNQTQMILSQCSDLKTRETKWVSYKNSETLPATVWAAKFSYIYAEDVKTPTFG